MWQVKAYGKLWVGRSPGDAIAKADAHGERYQLRAVSMIAQPVLHWR